MNKAIPSYPTQTVDSERMARRIHQKQHGVFYTDDDIGAYIANNTILPYILNLLIVRAPDPQRIHCLLTQCLRSTPERYIPVSLLHGCELELPVELALGISHIQLRTAWNVPTPVEYGLPHEIWRETIARRQHTEYLLYQLRTNPPENPIDLVAFNLNLPKLAQDIITQLSAVEAHLCRTILGSLRILDPTCGAGALLLAALRVLQQLWAALGDLPDLLNRQDRAGTPYRASLQSALYGVDLMPAAVAACKEQLRLTLLECGEIADPDLLNQQIQLGDALNPATWQQGFSNILHDGGFDCVIGNPPYVTISQARQPAWITQYRTAICGNLYAYVVEQSLALLRPNGWCGMIVPIASISTASMVPLQALYATYDQWHSHYAVRPGKLFSHVDMNLTISLLHKTPQPTRHYTTGYQRWSAGLRGGRAHLFETLRYQGLGQAAPHPKLGSTLAVGLLEAMLAHTQNLGEYRTVNGAQLYYHSGGRYWRKALLQRQSSHYKPLAVQPEHLPMVFALLNSQLFYWYWISHSNCMDVVSREVLQLPVFALEQADPVPYTILMQELLAWYAANTTIRERRGKQIHGKEANLAMAGAKPIIDQIDRLLAHDYGFTAEQLDFILNYDIKYRSR